MHDSNTTGFELPRCYPGTRTAIQRDLVRWVEDAGGHPIYWLYAPAGSGKSAIAKTFADACAISARRHLLASFFFRRTSVHQNTEERFISTIAYQIMTNLPQTSHFIANAVNADPAIFQKDLRVQMDELVLYPLIQACETATPAVCATWPRLLVIDGLDECSGEAAQRKILDAISHLVRQTPFPLAIFLSCRPAAHIRGAFQTGFLSTASLRICLPDTYDSQDDIRTFLIGEFQLARAHSQFLEFPRDWPGEDIIFKLIRKSSGQFIYVSTVMKYINVPHDNPMDRLEIVLGLQRASDSENPFAELDALYRHILKFIDVRYLPTVVLMLQVTLAQSQQEDYLYPPPDLQCELASFLRLRSGDLEYALKNLEGILVERLTNTPSLKFHHASFADFLLDEKRSGGYFINISFAYSQYIVHLFRFIFGDVIAP